MSALNPPSANNSTYVGMGASLPISNTLAYDASGNVEYIGESTPGSATGAAVWRISKLTYDGSGNVTNIQFANAGAFDQIWNDRTGLVYA